MLPVIKDCHLQHIGIGASEKNFNKEVRDQNVFLSHNSYASINSKYMTLSLLPAARHAKTENVHLYLYGKANIPGGLAVYSGNITILDAEIESLHMRQRRLDTCMANLNLRNVTIKSGKWEFADVRAGKWEKVNIYPPVDLNEAKFGTIIGHHVEFPHGTPWKNGSLNITYSAEPLQFHTPPVPTLEELGLARFWKENDFPVETY
jgi:hypothetical protein